MFRLFFALPLFCFALVFPAFALEIPREPDGYVTDRAAMLSGEARSVLEAKLKAFEDQTSNQIVIATFLSLEGGSLEDFSIRLAEAWKAGQKGKDNGVILLIFKNDRAVRIEVGYGLEGVLPDAVGKLIIENEIVPAFREGKFDEGINKAVDAIIAQTKGEYRNEAAPVHIDWNITFFAVALLLTLLSFGFFGPWGPFSNTYTMQGGKRRSDWSGGSGGSGSSGGGGFGGGGGFSGGGGGFGGGGASGRW